MKETNIIVCEIAKEMPNFANFTKYLLLKYGEYFIVGYE